MKYLYIYIKNEEADDILKYGIKLSEHANKILNYSNIQKSGILSYLAPKDCELYNNKNYSCLKVSTKNIKGLIYNNICENLTNFDEFICSFSEYNYGDYEEPLAIITSTILTKYYLYLQNKKRF